MFENLDQNRERHKKIFNKYKYFSKPAIYAANIKIASKFWCEYLNQINTNGLGVVNTGAASAETFAKLHNDGHYAPNFRFINKCIGQAKRKNVFRYFAFCYINPVLDKLENSIEKTIKKHNSK